MSATLGIDLSSQPGDTAACLVRWESRVADIEALELGCDDATLDALIGRADIVGVDAPFGWPDAFRQAVQQWDQVVWDIALRDRMRFRRTDEVVREIKRPLSVSTDTIALPAMRAMCLLRRHGVTAKDGSGGKFYEVYPAASLERWGLPSKGYKKKSDECQRVREQIVEALSRGLEGLPENIPDSDDKIDALVASLTARCVQLGLTADIPFEDRERAKTEGWIHVPTTRESLEKLFTSPELPETE